MTRLNPDATVKPIEWIKPGIKAANLLLQDFLNSKLKLYNENRSNPELDGQSNLSAYIHFGQISAQRIVIETLKMPLNKELTASFLDELIIRRELSDNFCYYNPNYDNLNGLAQWAIATLNKHRSDVREYNYSLTELEKAQTHDKLWNAAQMEMVVRGKMHGFMRMYWAKKILEWTASPEIAISTAIFLNDKYSLDGRDPNGYAGCLWAIGGLHDRPWGEKEVYGNIRYMNDKGCQRKFNTKKYIKKIEALII